MRIVLFRIDAPLFLLVIAVAGCGGSKAPAKPAPVATAPHPSAASSVHAAPDTLPPGTLYREEVVRVVHAGLGRFLQKVDVEASLDKGRFQGFRIVSLIPPEFWRGVDLLPGDVVQRVNGMPIERETQAYDAFRALETAPELRVSYLRGGRPRELVYRIIDRKSAKAH